MTQANNTFRTRCGTQTKCILFNIKFHQQKKNWAVFAQIRNLGLGGRTCLDSPARKKDLKKAVGLYPCHNQGGNQVNKENLMNRSRCSEGYRPKHVCEKKPNVKIELQTKPMPKIYKNITHQKDIRIQNARPFICFSRPFLFHSYIYYLLFYYCFVRCEHT